MICVSSDIFISFRVSLQTLHAGSLPSRCSQAMDLVLRILKAIILLPQHQRPSRGRASKAIGRRDSFVTQTAPGCHQPFDKSRTDRLDKSPACGQIAEPPILVLVDVHLSTVNLTDLIKEQGLFLSFAAQF